jgi:hypothetical protein
MAKHNRILLLPLYYFNNYFKIPLFSTVKLLKNLEYIKITFEHPVSEENQHFYFQLPAIKLIKNQVKNMKRRHMRSTFPSVTANCSFVIN